MAVHVLPMGVMSLLDEHERRHGSLPVAVERAAASTADGCAAGNRAETGLADHFQLASALPDVHRWVEARALLLAESCDVLEFRAAPELSAIVRDAEGTALFVIGNPDASVVEMVLRRSPLVQEVVAGNEHVALLGALLPQWSCSTIVVHRLRDAGRSTDASGDVRLLDPALIPNWRSMRS